MSQQIGGLYGISGKYICNVCNGGGVGAVYHCYPCLWDSHISCMQEQPNPPIDDDNIAASKQEDELPADPDTLKRTVKEKDIQLSQLNQQLTAVDAQSKENQRLLSLSLTAEDMFAQKMPPNLTDRRHAHNLVLTKTGTLQGKYSQTGFICAVCNTGGMSYLYHCESCQYDLHLPCATVNFVPDHQHTDDQHLTKEEKK